MGWPWDQAVLLWAKSKTFKEPMKNDSEFDKKTAELVAAHASQVEESLALEALLKKYGEAAAKQKTMWEQYLAAMTASSDADKEFALWQEKLLTFLRQTGRIL